MGISGGREPRGGLGGKRKQGRSMTERVTAKAAIAQLNMGPKSKRGKGPEALVSQACVDFMEARGWRAIRMSRAFVKFDGKRGVTFGERGMPDWFFVKYGFKVGNMPTVLGAVWIEMKQPGDKRKCTCNPLRPRKCCTVCDQQNWRIKEQVRGATVVKIASLDELILSGVWK